MLVPGWDGRPGNFTQACAPEMRVQPCSCSARGDLGLARCPKGVPRAPLGASAMQAAGAV